MFSINRSGGPFLLVAIASGLGILASAISPCLANDNGAANPTSPGLKARLFKPRAKPASTACGTLGYGPPGFHPGFQGFGLGYHLGHGYGGAALGVGATGGYPLYSGPGYPHPAPCLNRTGPITPFPHYGGPGGPTPDQPNYYGGVGAPLAPDTPVIFFERDPNNPNDMGDYGSFTGSIPYPEATFAPYTMAASSGNSNNGMSNTAQPPNASGTPPSNRTFGVTGEPNPDSGAGGLLGLQIQSILPGSVAERAGLHVGDVLLEINGRLIQRSSDLFSIIENVAADKVLKIKLRNANDGKMREVTTQMP